MKFSEMPYVRPDVEAVKKELNEVLEALKNAPDAATQTAAIERYNEITGHVSTMGVLANVRHTIDTRDEFYDKENDFIDENMPLLAEVQQAIGKAMLDSRFRPELEEKFGKLLFTNLEIDQRTFKPELVELMQEENKLESEYQKLYATGLVDFDGKQLPLPKLTPYKQSPDREIRKAALVAEGEWFDAHREELDTIFDKLVKNRTAQARALGHENFLQLGYDRLGRNCYGPKDVEEFRDQIAKDIVPVVAKVKKAQEKRLGLEKLMFWDDLMIFPDGNPVPQGTADDILAAGLKMYHELSPETHEFIDVMYGGELLDVLSKDGKAPGGYCTELYDYKVPFIFSNFNGTAGDVDVLTHEAGHAFAFYRAMKKGYIPQYLSPTMEACECHSMSMEFLTSPYHELFFGEQTRKYEIAHAEESLVFIPYGCMIDEFQAKVYENPDWTPERRNRLWLELEAKYRPWVDYGDLPFYSRGGGWQWKLHTYLHPLYYIDYCMAQTVAFQFWMASLKDREGTWDRYLTFVDKGGSKTFEELVHEAGLKVPYDPGCMREVGSSVGKWLEENPLN